MTKVENTPLIVSHAWCTGSEQYANCTNCYRCECEKRQSSPVLGLGTATSLGQDTFSCGRRKGGGGGSQ